MKCEFEYCVYNKDFACVLKEIQLNAMGMCEVCELISIPTEILETYKKECLQEPL